jgi:hypothetical protein
LIGTVKVSNAGNQFAAEFDTNDHHNVTAMHFVVYDSEQELAKTGGAPRKFINNVNAVDKQFIGIHFNARVAIDAPVVLE